MTGQGDSRKSEFNTALLSVLGAVGTGVGVLGFVTFVGGAVWLARYRGVGLSGSYSVGLLPRSELLATGADQLFAPAVAAVAITALACAAFFACRSWGVGPGAWSWLIVGLLAFGFGFGAAYYFWHETGCDGLIGPTIVAFATIVLAVGALVALQRWRWEKRHWPWFLGLAGGAVVLVALDAHYFATQPGCAQLQTVRVAYAGSVSVLALGGGLAYWLGRRAYATDSDRSGNGGWKLVAFIVVLVLTVFSYAALETYARNLAAPEVRPVAVLRQSAPDVAGIYVGQDDSTVYVGVLTPPFHPRGQEVVPGSRANARVIAIPRDDTEAIAVGGTLAPDAVARLAPCLLGSVQRLYDARSPVVC